MNLLFEHSSVTKWMWGKQNISLMLSSYVEDPKHVARQEVFSFWHYGILVTYRPYACKSLIFGCWHALTGWIVWTTDWSYGRRNRHATFVWVLASSWTLSNDFSERRFRTFRLHTQRIQIKSRTYEGQNWLLPSLSDRRWWYFKFF